MILRDTRVAAGDVRSLVAGNYLPENVGIREILCEAYIDGLPIVVTEEEQSLLEAEVTELAERLRWIDRVRCGILTESDISDSVAFVAECAATYLAEGTTIDEQVQGWRDNVAKAMADYNRLVAHASSEELLTEKKALAGVLIGLVGAGVSIVLAGAGGGFAVTGVVTLLISIGAALYYLYSASPHQDAADEAKTAAGKIKITLRLQARRILPQLDAAERGSSSKAAKAAIASLRSMLEAIALDEYEETQAMNRKIVAGMSAVSDVAKNQRSRFDELEGRIRKVEGR